MNELDLRQSMKRIEYLRRLISDSFRNQIDWLFDFCDRHKISIPLHDLEQLITLSRIAGDVLDKSLRESDDRIQPTKNKPSDEEEYRAQNRFVFILDLRGNDVSYYIR
jgi:hypothetical protein